MLENALQATFAVSVLIAAGSVPVAALGRSRPHPLAFLAGVLGAAAAGAWVAFALRPARENAVAAAGITVAAVAEAAAAALTRAVRRGRADERSVARARAAIEGMVTQETERVSADLQRWLARVRADSLSLLTEEERRIAEERRAELTEREGRVAAELAEVLAAVERRVDERLRGWTDDLDRAQQQLGAQLVRLEQRQREAIKEAESRIDAEAAELVSTSEEQRKSVLRLRDELERSAQTAVSEALDELQAHTGERRRGIEEIADRLRQREQALAEQVERAESEATRRIEASFADIERRQVEHLQRLVSREAERYAEAAGLQFEVSMKGAREEAAGRFSRELDRAVETFVRQADAVFADRLAHTGDAGQQRLEARLRQAHAAFERQREDLSDSFTQKIADADAHLRRTLGGLVAEAESERSALEARRIDDAHASVRSAD